MWQPRHSFSLRLLLQERKEEGRGAEGQQPRHAQLSVAERGRHRNGGRGAAALLVVVPGGGPPIPAGARQVQGAGLTLRFPVLAWLGLLPLLPEPRLVVGEEAPNVLLNDMASQRVLRRGLHVAVRTRNALFAVARRVGHFRVELRLLWLRRRLLLQVALGRRQPDWVALLAPLLRRR